MPILRGKLRGKRWIAGAHTHGCWLGTYEDVKQQLFSETVKPDAVVYDIGANVGFYTLLSSVLVGPQGFVYAFEPLPRNISFLREHLRLNLITNAKIVEAAVCDQAGETDFDDAAGSAMGHLSQAGRLRVKTVTIDGFISDNNALRPDYLKIDVEGDEMQVLSGARRLLESRRPKLFLATHGAEIHRQCCEFLTSFGYKLRPIDHASIENTDELLAY